MNQGFEAPEQSFFHYFPCAKPVEKGVSKNPLGYIKDNTPPTTDRSGLIIRHGGGESPRDAKLPES